MKNSFFILLLVCFTYTSGYAALYINEVNSTGKWIEIYNSGESEVNMSGYYVRRFNNNNNSGITVIPAGTIIAPNGFLVLYQGPVSGGAAISPIEGAVDCLSYGISSTKFMRVVLMTPSLQVVDDTFTIGYPQSSSVVRDQSWARATDGSATIVAMDPTPGTSNTSPPSYSDKKIYINEVNSTGKWIELYNDEDKDENVGGYILTRNNNDDAVGNAAIPLGTVIKSKDFLVLYRGSTAPSPVEDAIDCLPYGISATKFTSVLLRDPQRNVVDNTFYVGDPQEITVSKGKSWVRETDGGDTIIASDPTPGKPNDSDPLFSDLKIYINEVNASGNWVELYNDEDSVINVGGYILIRINSDEAAGTAAIPGGTVIKSKGFLVLYQGTVDGETAPSPVAGAIDCLPFGISSTKFESIIIKDTKGYFVDNTFDIDDPQTVTVSGGQSWAREPDGSDSIKAQKPTPGAPNERPTSISALNAENNLVSVHAGFLNVPERTSDIQLFTISGTHVLHRNITETSIDLTHLPNGFYLVKLTVSGISYTQKIVLL